MSRQVCSILVFLVLVLSSSSCTIFRKGTRNQSQTDSTGVSVTNDSTLIDSAKAGDVTAVERQTYLSGFQPILGRTIDFTSFSAKAKMRYEGKTEKQEFTSHFRLVKDKAIWVSVTAMGGIVQVARVLITPDSFRMINYLQKEVTIMPLADAGKVLPAPVDFQILQNLIIGNVLRQAGKLADATDLGNIIALQVEEENVIQQITYNKADSTIKSLQLRSITGPLMTGLIQFSNYGSFNGKKFSMDRTVNVINGGDQYNLEMNFNNPTFDQPLELPFSMPKNYKRK